MNNISIHCFFKMPAVHLAGDHEIDLEWFYLELFKIYCMLSRTPGK